MTLQRAFNWSTNILWPFEIPNFTDPSRTAVFLAGNDTILNARRVRKYLRENGMEDADTPYYDREAGEWRTKEGDAKGGGGIVTAWDALHGEALIHPMPQFDRIFRWLKGDGVLPYDALQRH